MNPFTAHDRRLPDDLRTDEQIELDSIQPVKSAYVYDAAKWAKVTALRLAATTGHSEQKCHR